MAAYQGSRNRNQSILDPEIEEGEFCDDIIPPPHPYRFAAGGGQKRRGMFFPDSPKDQPAKDGLTFPLYDKPAKEWLEWAPNIPPVPVKQAHEKDLKQNLVKPPARQTNNVQERRRSED